MKRGRPARADSHLTDIQADYANDREWRLVTGTTVLTWDEWVGFIIDAAPIVRDRRSGVREVPRDPAESQDRWEKPKRSAIRLGIQSQ